MRRSLLFTLTLLFFCVCSALAGADESAPRLLAAGRVDEVLRALNTQITHEPNDALAYNLLCRAYFSVAQWDQSVAACEKSVALAPQNGLYHLWLGRAYGEKADHSNPFVAAGLAKRVRTEFEAAVRLSPENEDAHSELAEFYFEAPGIVGGDHDKARQQADWLLSVDPARAHWVRARIAEKEHDYSLAEAEYKLAIDASHGGASTWLNLGLFYRHREHWREMQEALEKVRSAPLDRADALVDAAEILLHTRRNLPEAVELLRAYLKLDSKVEQAPAFKVHYLLGSTIERLGDKQAAAAEYRSALELAREFEPAQQALQRVSR